MDVNRVRDQRHLHALASQNARRQESLQRNRIPSVTEIPLMVGMLNSDERNSQLRALQKFISLLRIDDPPIQEVVQAGVVPRFVQFLRMNHFNDLQSQAARVLAIISTDLSEEVRVVMSQVFPDFVKLVVSMNETVCEEAVKALANIIPNSSSCRDLLVESEEWVQFLSRLNEHSKVSVLKDAIIIVAKLCGRLRVTGLDKLKPCICLLDRLYFYSSDTKVLGQLTKAFCDLLGDYNMRNRDDMSYLIELVKRNDFPSLQFEVAWRMSLTGVGTISQTQLLANHGVIPIFGRILASESERLRHEAAFCLVQLIDMAAGCRELVLKSGLVTSLFIHLNSNSHMFATSKLLWRVTYTLGTMCRGIPSIDQVEAVVPGLAHTLVCSVDEEVLSNVASALFFLSEHHYERVQVEIEALFYRYLELLGHSRWVVRDHSLGTVGNILSKKTAQSQVINSALPVISRMIKEDEMPSIQRKACRILSKMSFRDRELQVLVDPGLIGSIFKLLQSDYYIEASELLNAICHGAKEQISVIVAGNCIYALCNLLSSSDPRTALLCLDGIHLILKAGCVSDGCSVRLIQEANGIEQMEELRNHDNHQISMKAKQILKTYFEE